MKALNLFIKGIFVGVANIIPGVSGGTIAVVLRIFDELIEAINNFYKDFRKYFKFLLPVILGAIVGIGLFSKAISWGLDNFPIQTNMFFVGLVVGSIPLIYSKAKEKEVKPVHYLVAVIAFVLVLSLSLLSPAESNVITDISIGFMAKLLIFGAIASAAMVIPGISGSFVMVLLGIYTTVLTAISNITNPAETVNSLKIIIPVGIGVVLGILVISRIIAFLLERFFSITYFAILGLIFSSIVVIIKDMGVTNSALGVVDYISTIVIFAIGYAISYYLSKE